MHRTALITGGTGGLGTAVVETFVEAGWRVVVPVEPGHEGHHEGALYHSADLCEADATAAVVALAAGEADAPLGAVVNLVGGFHAGARVHETPIDVFEAQYRLNLRPTYLVTQAALPSLLEAKGGAIVCVGTRAALRPFSGAAGYITSKAAVLSFVQALDAEYRADGIRANAVLPSIIDTAGQRAAEPDADHSRWVAPAEIARVIRFLCSEDSAPTSGAWIPVYGCA